MEEKDLFWQELLHYFKKQPEISQESYTNFISSAQIKELSPNLVSVVVPNTLYKLYWEKNLKELVYQFGIQTFGTEYQLHCIVAPNLNAEKQTQTAPITKPPIVPIVMEPVEPNTYSQTQLNANYTFDNFVIGEDNKMANVAALAVCDGPGKTYNPFLIYGGVGLGKTHLMQAIGNEILTRNPAARIKYATTESFTNDFITSIQNGSQEDFRKMYRDIDVLLIDDIQFLSQNKEKTKEEFFHTFNALFNHGKQIVLTCDRLPNTIPGLEDRLISRFKWGLSADITPPDFETRIAILRKKASSEFNAETLTYIANNINTNIRELEGALHRVTAYAAIHGKEITTHLAAEALSSLIGRTQTESVTTQTILKQVSQFYNVSIDEIKGRKRNKEIVHPRQVAMYLSRELTESSFPKIGEEFGNKNHTTVIHAYEKVMEQLTTDAKLQQELVQLKQQLGINN